MSAMFARDPVIRHDRQEIVGKPFLSTQSPLPVRSRSGNGYVHVEGATSQIRRQFVAALPGRVVVPA